MNTGWCLWRSLLIVEALAVTPAWCSRHAMKASRWLTTAVYATPTGTLSSSVMFSPWSQGLNNSTGLNSLAVVTLLQGGLLEKGLNASLGATQN